MVVEVVVEANLVLSNRFSANWCNGLRLRRILKTVGDGMYSLSSSGLEGLL